MKIIANRIRLSASDVANFLACQHLTRLDLLKARGVLDPPYAFDVGFQDLVSRGEVHETTVLYQFRAQKREIVEIGDGLEDGGAQATLEAIRGGADVIYQGVLLQEEAADEPALLGRPDFLVRADLLGAPDDEPRPAGVHYEVVDAKLARSAKGRAVAQTALVVPAAARDQLQSPGLAVPHGMISR